MSKNKAVRPFNIAEQFIVTDLLASYHMAALAANNKSPVTRIDPVAAEDIRRGLMSCLKTMASLVTNDELALWYMTDQLPVYHTQVKTAEDFAGLVAAAVDMAKAEREQKAKVEEPRKPKVIFLGSIDSGVNLVQKRRTETF
jgi:hypothetical protein